MKECFLHTLRVQVPPEKGSKPPQNHPSLHLLRSRRTLRDTVGKAVLTVALVIFFTAVCGPRGITSKRDARGEAEGEAVGFVSDVFCVFSQSTSVFENVLLL